MRTDNIYFAVLLVVIGMATGCWIGVKMNTNQKDIEIHNLKEEIMECQIQERKLFSKYNDMRMKYEYCDMNLQLAAEQVKKNQK